ncbi:nuclear transport factor 2 family protein [Streptomyces huiliensis]|uniref:nuclear transport factor 2 family protein n=1 Tax=Streptomyces huiliensis TaxID=2876027 RepID=UPI001CC00AC5|nr:nuclear transport factor 2 family protein [Streptomyces huiliensis]MBZ4319361.1 nuclear transport factor 2 family protein [Streptomyces huiliensis]
MTVTDTTTAAGFAALYQQVQQFYAEQMHLLDTGRAEEWAETFTEDGVFAANAHPEPAAGRSVIAAAARKAVDDYVARGIQRRHWLGMVSVTERGDGEVAASCYALVVETGRGGRPELRASTSCDDVLVRRDGRWLVKDRQVRRDDLG